MDIARLNFSHGTYSSHAQTIHNIRKVSTRLNHPIAIMQDLSGPKLRLGELHERQVLENEIVVFGPHGIPVAQPIWQWIRPGQTILIDDGLIELVATKVSSEGLEAKVIAGGILISHKGINLPGINVDLPTLSDKDLADLEFGLKNGVDLVAQSFVKTAGDITKLKALIKRIAKREVPVVAKIETPEALKNLRSIIKVSDAIMVARGDLALNTPQAKELIEQKQIVKVCLDQGMPVIVATQMLDSMIHNPRPTRAEISDVANAVIDHVDAVMLSGETAFGKYPVKAVETMSQIIQETESSIWDDYKLSKHFGHKNKQEALAHHLHEIAMHAVAKTIVVSDLLLAKMLSHLRQELKIVFMSEDYHKLAQACLLWGVEPVKSLSILSSLQPKERFVDATNFHKSAVIHSIH